MLVTISLCLLIVSSLIILELKQKYASTAAPIVTTTWRDLKESMGKGKQEVGKRRKKP